MAGKKQKMTEEDDSDRARPILVTLENNREYKIQSYVVCIVDLLEQSERLQGWPALPKDGRPTPELVEAVDKTADTVRRFREMFREFFDAFGKREMTEKELDHLKPEMRPEFLRIRERTREADMTTRQFSDTFVFYAPDANSYGDRTGDVLDRMMGAAAFGLLAGLAEGNPYRGAITVDDGTEIEGTEIEPSNFYGPAMARAHEMEDGIAEYPRIVLSRKAVEFAQRNSGFSGDVGTERLLVESHRSPSDLLCTDADGLTIVDFMGEKIQSVASTMPPGYAALGSRAYDFARSEAARFERAGNIKLSGRYHQLLHYMRPRLSFWGIDPNAGAVPPRSPGG
ncbi:MAG: hypothetical protein IIC86_09545 [Chloroflexi bacterium]|nr:hypothetical protein [Chloroflexota bacterium]